VEAWRGWKGGGRGRNMDKITIKTPNPKCYLYWCLIEFVECRLEIQSVMLVFSTPLVKYCPSNLLIDSPTPFPV
jgi:hypothetical protein